MKPFSRVSLASGRKRIWFRTKIQQHGLLKLPLLGDQEVTAKRRALKKKKSCFIFSLVNELYLCHDVFQIGCETLDGYSSYKRNERLEMMKSCETWEDRTCLCMTKRVFPVYCDAENGGSMILRNVGNAAHFNTVQKSQNRLTISSDSP